MKKRITNVLIASMFLVLAYWLEAARPTSVEHMSALKELKGVADYVNSASVLLSKLEGRVTPGMAVNYGLILEGTAEESGLYDQQATLTRWYESGMIAADGREYSQGFAERVRNSKLSRNEQDDVLAASHLVLSANNALTRMVEALNVQNWEEADNQLKLYNGTVRVVNWRLGLSTTITPLPDNIVEKLRTSAQPIEIKMEVEG